MSESPARERLTRSHSSLFLALIPSYLHLISSDGWFWVPELRLAVVNDNGG